MRAPALMIGLLALFVPARVFAHKASDSYLTLTQAAHGLNGQWDIALRDLDRQQTLDQNGDGAITWGELHARESEVVAAALGSLTLSQLGKACALAPEVSRIARHSDGTYLSIPFQIRCQAARLPDQMRYTFLFQDDAQHRAVVRLSAAGRADRALVIGKDTGDVALDFAVEQPSSLFALVAQGIGHILSGFDHVLFLLALLLPAVLRRRLDDATSTEIRRAWSDVVKVVTAFTVAHSLTLGLAGLGLVSVQARIVEPAIAASVALAAANNLVPVFGRERWSMAFALGLLHGFGFSSALADVGLGGASLLRTLFGFNLGVELGQLAIVLAFIPVALLLQRRELWRSLALRAGSFAILTVSIVWIVQRLEQG